MRICFLLFCVVAMGAIVMPPPATLDSVEVESSEFVDDSLEKDDHPCDYPLPVIPSSSANEIFLNLYYIMHGILHVQHRIQESVFLLLHPAKAVNIIQELQQRQIMYLVDNSNLIEFSQCNVKVLVPCEDCRNDTRVQQFINHTQVQYSIKRFDKSVSFLHVMLANAMTFRSDV